MHKQHPLILLLDKAGTATNWISFETAAYYYAKDLVSWSMGDEGFTIHGGENRITGNTSFMDLNTIIAVKGEMGDKHKHRTPALTNKALFRRDQNICAYCGNEFHHDELTRDHIHPRSKGGPDNWMNVVASCGGCNRFKNDRTPEEAGLKLRYVPYAPCRNEYLLLMNRTILACQMEFLKARIPKHSRVHNPINQ